jgi:uncharacterized protein (TIGR03435 family)
MKYLTAIVTLAIAYAAGPDPKFDVAVIKPTAPDGAQHSCGPPFGAQPGPLQYVLLDCTVRELVGRSWSLRKFEFFVAAEPAWISSAHYDITAKSAAPVNPMQHDKMLQPLLEERFHLKWHREKRQLPVYFLTAAKGGVKLTATAAGSCIPWDRKSPPPFPMPGKPPTCDYILMPGTPDRLGLGMEGTGVPMSSFASHLTDLLGRPVIDNTGFAGIFDIHIKFARDSSLAFGGVPDQPGQAAETSGLPNIFTAIRALGLNIVAGKGPVDVFVIDSVQRPSEN